MFSLEKKWDLNLAQHFLVVAHAQTLLLRMTASHSCQRVNASVQLLE